MSEIVGIGANVCDTIVVLPQFPKEDTKLRAESACQAGGGPVATGLVAAAKLGASCAYLGYVSKDSAGDFLIKDFAKYGVSTELTEAKQGAAFTSVVLLNEANATRTVVFDRGSLPPLSLSEEQVKAIENAKLLMVDGNDLDAAVSAAKIAKQSGTKVLYDAGGLYDNVEKLLPFADYLIPSEEFACGITGKNSAEKAAQNLFETYSPELVCVTCGKRGGVYFDGKVLKNYPAFSVDAIDTNGAGDVFHGAFAFAHTKGYDGFASCVFSSAVSALKCLKLGARAGVPAFFETIDFLKERGYHEF